MPARVILRQLASAIKLVVQVARLQDGSRKIVGIAEVLGAAGERVHLQEIFVFERLGVTDAGGVMGRFRCTGHRPRLLERLRVGGIEVPAQVFEETVVVNLA